MISEQGHVSDNRAYSKSTETQEKDREKLIGEWPVLVHMAEEVVVGEEVVAVGREEVVAVDMVVVGVVDMGL